MESRQLPDQKRRITASQRSALEMLAARRNGLGTITTGATYRFDGVPAVNYRTADSLRRLGLLEQYMAPLGFDIQISDAGREAVA